MTDLIYTRHAKTRMQQRGIRKSDIPIILAYGTQIDDETYLMCNRDAAREIETRKREIQTLSRLVNRKVVIRHRLSLKLRRSKTHTTPWAREGVWLMRLR